MGLGSRLRRSGLLLPAFARSVWVIAPDAGRIAAAYPLIDAALGRRLGYPLVLSTAADVDLKLLLRRYDRDVILPLPHAWATRRYVSELRPALVFLLADPGDWREGWLHALASRGIAVECLAAGDGAVEPAMVDRLAARLPELGQGRDVRESFRRPRRLARFVGTPLGRRAIDLFGRRRIDSWEDLKRLLGAPRTILCLGNGPSSESPDIASIEHDCLFRVNWRWQARGLLTSPDLVLVGDPQTPWRIQAPVFGFLNRDLANHVLWRQCLALRPPRYRFFVFDSLPSAAAARNWPARPTNGAVMIAAAAALAPERLVIAGIDLYQHPAGRYPGVADAPDGYARVHDREVEIEIVRQALCGFRGRVEILSPALRQALADPAPATAP
jgi:hypothetical protein